VRRGWPGSICPNSPLAETRSILRGRLRGAPPVSRPSCSDTSAIWHSWWTSTGGFPWRPGWLVLSVMEHSVHHQGHRSPHSVRCRSPTREGAEALGLPVELDPTQDRVESRRFPGDRQPACWWALAAWRSARTAADAVPRRVVSVPLAPTGQLTGSPGGLPDISDSGRSTKPCRRKNGPGPVLRTAAFPADRVSCWR